MPDISIAKQFDLQALHTLALPAKSRYYCQAKTIDDMLQALRFVHLQRVPLFILGGGSNCFFADDYFSGLVLHIANKGVQRVSEDDNSVLLKVAAGMNWDAFLQYCLAEGYYGLENLAIIPGTVGAAPVQNIGAYGQEVASCIEQVDAIAVASGQLLSFDNRACQFAYRDSLFKRQAGDYIISHVQFRLSKTFKANIEYQALANALKGQALTAQNIRQQVINIRQSKLPDPATLPNCGSFFKNPEVDANTLNTLLEAFPELVYFPLKEGQAKIAAGWLIEQAGFKGKALGPVAMHSQQALVLVKPEPASFDDVTMLAKTVQEAVFTKFGVMLEQEPIVVR